MLHAFHLSETHAFVSRYQGKPLPATNLTAVSVSHRHIIISFRTGLDGGFSQTITGQYRTGSGNFHDGISRQFDVGFLDMAEFLVSEELEPVTAYSIRLVSDNDHTAGRAAESDVITIRTRGNLLLPLRCSFACRSESEC